VIQFFTPTASFNQACAHLERLDLANNSLQAWFPGDFTKFHQVPPENGRPGSEVTVMTAGRWHVVPGRAASEWHAESEGT